MSPETKEIVDFALIVGFSGVCVFGAGYAIGYFRGYRTADDEANQHMEHLRTSHRREKDFMRSTHAAAKSTILHAIADDLMVLMDKHKIPVRVFMGKDEKLEKLAKDLGHKSTSRLHELQAKFRPNGNGQLGQSGGEWIKEESTGHASPRTPSE